MPTSNITNTLLDPSGTPQAGATVRAILVPKGARRISDGSSITPVESAVTNGAGQWTLTLEEQSNITPAGSYWRIEENLLDGSQFLWAISVPAGDSTLADALIVYPPVPAPNFVGASHTHPESEVVNLEADLAARATDAELAAHEGDSTGVHGIANTAALATDAEVATAITNHEGAANPHPGYLEPAEHGAINHAGIPGVPAAGISGQGTGGNSVLVGDSAVASADQSVALGDFANSSADGGISVGSGTNATSAPQASGQGAIAIGPSNAAGVLGARASGIGSVAIGSGTATGRGARALADGAVAIGGGVSSVGARAEGVQGIAIGEFSWGLGDQSVAIGVGAEANDTGAVAVGNSTNCDGLRGVAVGNNAQCYGDDGIALGTDSVISASHADSMAIGRGVQTTASEQIMLGRVTQTLIVPGKFAGASRMGWRLTRAADQPVTQDILTAISWDTEEQDTPGNFTPHATTGTTLTVPAGGDGLWAIYFQIDVQAVISSMGYLRLEILAGGISYKSDDFDDVGNPVPGRWSVSVPNAPLVATNTIVCNLTQSGTAVANVRGRLHAYRLGA